MKYMYNMATIIMYVYNYVVELVLRDHKLWTITKMLYFRFCILPGNKNKVFLIEGRVSVAQEYYSCKLCYDVY